jgi:hypothetical protein
MKIIEISIKWRKAQRNEMKYLSRNNRRHQSAGWRNGINNGMKAYQWRME